MPRCNSWTPNGTAGMPYAGWKMCRRRVPAKGRRCDGCWAALSGHALWAVRAELAVEIADAPAGADPAPEDVWNELVQDHSEEVRLSLIGPATPAQVLAVLATDESLSVRDMAASELASRKNGTITLKAG